MLHRKGPPPPRPTASDTVTIASSRSKVLGWRLQAKLQVRRTSACNEVPLGGSWPASTSWVRTSTLIPVPQRACLRHRSGAVAPAWCSFSIPMICS